MKPVLERWRVWRAASRLPVYDSRPRGPPSDPVSAQASRAARGRAPAGRRWSARCCASRAATRSTTWSKAIGAPPSSGATTRARMRWQLQARVAGRPPAHGARPGTGLFHLVPGGEPGREGASHPPPPRVLPGRWRQAAARRHRGFAGADQGAGTVARGGAATARQPRHRTDIHLAPDRVHAPHAAAAPAAHGRRAAGPAEPQARSHRAAACVGAAAHRDHHRLADRGASAPEPDAWPTSANSRCSISPR